MSKLKDWLYPAFHQWIPNNGNIWFISDTHFGDEEIRKSLRSEFKDVDEMDEFIIKSINNKCGKNDTLVILGDVGRKESVLKLRAKYKVLIRGNHDTDIEVRNLFDEVYNGVVMINDKVLLSHQICKFKYALNVCGHHHRSLLDRVEPNTVLCLVAELINYTPFSLKMIMELPKDIKNIHREFTDYAIENKEKRENKK